MIKYPDMRMTKYPNTGTSAKTRGEKSHFIYEHNKILKYENNKLPKYHYLSQIMQFLKRKFTHSRKMYRSVVVTLVTLFTFVSYASPPKMSSRY